VVSIEDEAFTGCVSLTTVTNQSTTPQALSSNVFENVTLGGADLYLLQPAVSMYQSAAVWQDFKQVLPIPIIVTSVADNNLEILMPPEVEIETAVVAPVGALSGEFTIGPNPVRMDGGNLPSAVKFYRQGKRIDNAALVIFDALGNFIRKINITDKVVSGQSRRVVGSWDLNDALGRPVSTGTYLVKGVIKTSDGKNEKVSLILGVK